MIFLNVASPGNSEQNNRMNYRSICVSLAVTCMFSIPPWSQFSSHNCFLNCFLNCFFHCYMLLQFIFTVKLDVHATLLHVHFITGISLIRKHVPSLNKVVYLENRQFLPEGHELRRTKRFPGVEHETCERPNCLTNEDILWSAVAHSRAKNKTQASNVLKVKCFL